MSNSFYPAAKKVFTNPIVKWVTGLLLAGLTATMTTGIYPFFQGWVATRASTEQVDRIEEKVDSLDKAMKIDPERLNFALNDDVSSLTEAEKIQWLIIRMKRLQEQHVIAVRERVGLEAQLKMPRPNSKPARQTAASVMRAFDALILRGEKPSVAAEKAIEQIFGK